jgi:hypothetical protein
MASQRSAAPAVADRYPYFTRTKRHPQKQWCRTTYANDKQTPAAYAVGHWVEHWSRVADCGNQLDERCPYDGVLQFKTRHLRPDACRPQPGVADVADHFGVARELARVDHAVAGFRAGCEVRWFRDGGYRRDCAAQNGSERLRVLESLRWRWQPRGCATHEPSPDGWARLLARRRLYLVGDSLLSDMASTLKCLITAEEDARNAVDFFRNDNFCWRHTEHVGNESHRGNVELVRAMLRGNLPEQRRRAREEPHGERSILVFNGGSHARDSESAGSYAAAYARGFAFARAIREVFRGTVVYLTVVRGHPCCQRFSNPLSQADAARVTANGWYNWKEFDDFNAATVQAFRDADLPSFHVLDLSMFVRRADGHPAYKGDCLHYCTPGPVIWWNHLLYHLLTATLPAG